MAILTHKIISNNSSLVELTLRPSDSILQAFDLLRNSHLSTSLKKLDLSKKNADDIRKTQFPGIY
jgi:hypothetical protein